LTISSIFKYKGSSLAGNSSIYLAANTVNALVSFITIPILVRLLTAAEYGVVGVFQSLLSIFVIFVGLGSHDVARVRYFKSSIEEYQELISTIIFILVISAMVFLLVVYISMPWIIERTNIEENVIYMIVLGAFGQFVVTLKLAMWQVKNESIKYSILKIGLSIFIATLSIALIKYFGFGESGRIYGVVLPYIFLAFFILFSMRETIGQYYGGPHRYFALIMRYSIPLIPHALVAASIILFSRIALSMYQGESASGIFFLAWQLSMPVSILIASINLPFKTWSYEKMKIEGSHREIVRVSYIIMVLIMAASLLYSFFIFFGYQYIATNEFYGGRSLTIILTLSMMFSGFYLVVAKGIFFMEETKKLSILTSTIGVFFCFVIFVVAPIYGALGVAVSQLVYSIVLFFSVWVLANKVCPQPWLYFLTAKNK
jgi:O-antigen/teichoic acid export membrane protein